MMLLQRMVRGRGILSQKKRTVDGVSQVNEHDRCSPICEGPHCAEGLTYCGQASQEALEPRSSL